MTREELIKVYERRLEMVIELWKDDPIKERGRAYIEFAEAELEAVKNGREW